MDEVIEELNAPEGAADFVALAWGLVPYVGGSISTAIGQYQHAVFKERVQDTFRLAAKRLQALADRVSSLDQRFLDLATRIAPLVARTTGEEKRRLFANLLANGALRPPDEEGDTGQAMAGVLDQLTFRDVRVLQLIAARALVQHVKAFEGGAVREADVPVRSFKVPGDAVSLRRLRAVGLLEFDELPVPRRDYTTDSTRFTVTPYGVQFLDWITEPGT